jgi:predicted unusual protein kinase regulating ubiquinone biosynthesis (AarF/ABC1/UbiB family)
VGKKEEQVAIKLIHPHIEETVRLDMKILKGVVWALEKIPQMKCARDVF